MTSLLGILCSWYGIVWIQWHHRPWTNVAPVFLDLGRDRIRVIFVSPQLAITSTGKKYAFSQG